MRITFLIGLCLALASGMACGFDTQGRLRDELAKGLQHGMPSISVAIATRQGVIWETAVGQADLETHAPAHPGYLYGIGSVTKVFVACVIEQLVDEGHLSLDSRLSDILDASLIVGIPNTGTATIRELLDHTSGIPSWEFDPLWIRRGRGGELDARRIWTKAETLDYLRTGRSSAKHAPGAGYTYSNTNYTLLGLVIERMTGHDAVEEVHRRVLDPHGLTDIRFEGSEPIDPGRLPARYHFGSADFLREAGMSPGFRRVSPQLIDVSRSNLSTEWTAGAIVATAHDLALFARDLRDGRIVSAAALTRMQSFHPTDDADEDMGQGLALDRYGRERLIGYTGNVLGFGAAVGWVPDDDVVIALTTNVGAMHSGASAYYPERLLKETQVLHFARMLSRELSPRAGHAPVRAAK